MKNKTNTIYKKKKYNIIRTKKIFKSSINTSFGSWSNNAEVSIWVGPCMIWVEPDQPFFIQQPAPLLACHHDINTGVYKPRNSL